MPRRRSSGFWYDDENIPNITDRSRHTKIIDDFNSQQLKIRQLTDEELIELDRAYAKLRRFDEAITCHLEVLRRANEAKLRSKEGDAHENLAYAYHNTRQFENSKRHYNEALKINEIYGVNLVDQRINKRLGKLHQQLNENDSEIVCFKKLLLISQTIKDPHYTRDAYEALADVYQRQEKYVKAIDFHQKHRKILTDFRQRFQRESWRKWYNDVTKRLGECYRQDGNNTNALRQYQKYYNLISGVDKCPTIELVNTMTIIARLHVAMGNYKNACKWYEGIIGRYQQNEDDEVSEMVVDAMVSLADIELQQKDFENAYRHYSDAYEHAEALPMKLKQSQICCKQGIVYLNKGSHLEARGNFNKALEIAKSLPAEQKENQMRVVNIYISLLDDPEELENECYRKAFEMTRDEDGDKRLLHDKMGELYLRSNLKTKALECYEKSLKIHEPFRNTNKERIGHTYERIAYICQQQRNYTRAEENYLEARAIAKDVQDWKLYVHLTLQLGELCKRQKQFEEATAYYEDANTTANRRVKFLLPQTHAATGKFYVASVQFDKAEVQFLKQLEEARKYKDQYMEVDAFLSLASLSFKQEETQNGIDYLLQVNLNSIENFDLRRRLGEAYSGLADSYQPQNQQLKQKAVDRAIENFENAHQAWDEQTELRPQTGYERNLRNSQELTGIYIQKGDTKRALYHRLNSGERPLTDELIRRDANCSQRDAFKLIQVLKNAPFGVLVYSFHEENSMHVWNFQGNAVEPTFSTINASVIQVQGLIEACCKNGQKKKEVINSLMQLYKILIAPIEDTLTKEELVIDADGPLHNVPFAALRNSTRKYLFQYKRVRIAPSLQSLQLIMERPKDYHSVNGALVIAASDVESVYHEAKVKDMEPLQSADEEAKSIADLFGVEPLTGQDASKQNFLKRMKQKPAIIHIAAHGSEGKIYLASTTPPEKDHLTMDDVRAIEVKAQLVVLSCCSSGKGDVTNAGEVLAMSRVFIAAGARAVIATLWNIYDKTSPVLMVELYKGLKRKSIGTSLQYAMGHVRRQRGWSHPKYWAPFVHIGDDFKIDPSTFPAEKKPSKDVNASPIGWNSSTKLPESY